MLDLQGEGGAVSRAGVGRLANIGVTIQRRWANVLSDATRQVVVECFLGLRLRSHFPTQALPYGEEEGLPLDEAEEDVLDLDDVAAAKPKVKPILNCIAVVLLFEVKLLLLRL